MNKKSYAYLLAAALPLLLFAVPDRKERVINEKLLQTLSRVPDSAFQDVKKEDLLVDEVYMKLVMDGWTSEEIRTIMNDYVARNRKQVRGSNEYGRYAKQWLPRYGYLPGADSLYMMLDTTYSEEVALATRAAAGVDYDESYTSEFYSPEPRKRGERQPGIFRPLMHHPSCGRIHWIQVHPDDPDKIMCVPDGGGIFRTDDGGVHWECITDRIPNRNHRTASVHSAIPVDPDDWNHVFAMMENPYPVYETRDGGKTWRQIVGATNKVFKRGHCFRDADGNLKIIGAKQDGGSAYWASPVYISEDTCKTWTQVVVPDSLKDIHPVSGVKGNWFQEFAFDPQDRNRIYMPTSRSIFYFDDGGKCYTENGNKVYKIKKMRVKVYNQDKTVLRSDTTVFPFQATSQGFLNVDPNHPNRMWYALSARATNTTALYYSDDRGATWITLHEPTAGIGSGTAFGNEAPWGWLGGFGVNYADSTWIYGCSMSSAISSDGGKNFSEFGWGNRLMWYNPETGTYNYTTNSRHNADNHCIVSHKSGRVYRSGDSGIMIKDKKINNNAWTNIGGDMGQMLYYAMQTNEFGDQLVVGNTQDIDVQTYRGGRWGNWRGYEGTNSFIDPFSNKAYYSGSGGQGLENMYESSWSNGYTWADVVTGAWYLRQDATVATNLMRIENGRTANSLMGNIGGDYKVYGVALARDKGVCTLFIWRSDNSILRSTDNGQTFEVIFKTSATKAIAADPNNSDIIYIGSTGCVYCYDIPNKKLTTVGTGLPSGLSCSQLHFHEGSGDLYFTNTTQGIFLKEKDSDKWVYWTKGFNTNSHNRTQINYTTQEMYISSYGRGVFAADLQNPADRFFSNGFALTEKSNVDGRRTIGIDTKWTIPLYYYYAWTVNGVARNNPYQYLTDSLKAGDRVQLTLTLRESPDVKTTSAEYVVQATESTPLVATRGKAVYSPGDGKIDLGWVDYFFNDFTIDMWVKPMGDGVILCNSQKDYDAEAKGWTLAVSSSQLVFRLMPANRFAQPTYETAYTQYTDVNAGTIAIGQWHHVAVTHERNGYVTLYVDGVQKARAARILSDYTLNNTLNLTLFGDGFDRQRLEGYADELKIWNRALSLEEVRNSMYCLNSNNRRGLVYYNNFDGAKLADNVEAFSKAVPQFRGSGTMAQAKMPILLAADTAMTLTPGRAKRYFATHRQPLTLRSKSDSIASPVSSYIYSTASLLDFPSNLDTTYYSLLNYSYYVTPFASLAASQDSVTLAISGKQLSPNHRYRLYGASATDSTKYWTLLTEMTYVDSIGEIRSPLLSLNALKEQLILPLRVKPSIEVTVPRINASGQAVLYTDGITEWPYSAVLMENLDEPFAAYSMKSNSSLLTPSAMSFQKGTAEGTIRVDSRYAGNFGDVTAVTLSGEDKKMMPVSVNVVNRIAPTDAGGSALVRSGGIVVGSAADYAALASSNTVTMMTWVRIDDASVLSGTKPLIMFRGTKTTAIHLQDGNVRCHWNEESWSWNTSTTLSVTTADVGKWIHVALVARPNGIDYYLNGMKYTLTRTMSATSVTSPLMLGQNQQGNTWFSGAFDHTAVWNRSLTQAEVLYYMHHAVPLDDAGLVSYLNMDYVDPSTGRVRDLVKDVKTVSYGTVTPNHRSPAPFRAVDYYASNAADVPATLTGKTMSWHLGEYEAYPYNWQDSTHLSYRPLKKAYNSLTLDAPVTFATTDTLTLTLKDDAIQSGDTLYLALRQIGSETPFANYYQAKSVSAGAATFRFAGSALAKGAEWMLCSGPNAKRRPTVGSLAFKQTSPTATVSGSDILLGEDDNELNITVKITSSNIDDRVHLNIDGAPFASVASDSVDVNKSESTFTVRIDRNKIDRMAWNTLRLQLAGATADPLTLRVGLKPKVNLSLKNGYDAYHIIANEPIVTLEVDADLVEGVLDGEVKLATTSDYHSAMSIGGGTLLSNRNVTTELDYFESDNAKYSGWNLIGNPYLANINLTKRQNVSYEDGALTRFLYTYNGQLKNYEAVDMTAWDETQKVAPFNAYFVQANHANAKITVTANAKSTTVNRKTLDYYTALERTSVRLTLSTGSTLNDRTEVVLEEDALPEFVVGEDAVKIRSLSSTANQLFTLAGTDELSINTLPPTAESVPVALSVGTLGSLRIGADRIQGFTEGELLLVDNETGKTWTPATGTYYEFAVAKTGDCKNRFTLQIKRSVTDIKEAQTGYQIAVGNGRVSIDGLADNAVVDIFDVQGRRAVSEAVRGGSFSAEVAQGVYVVRIMEGTKQYTAKIVVR